MWQLIQNYSKYIGMKWIPSDMTVVFSPCGTKKTLWDSGLPTFYLLNVVVSS